MKRHFTKNSSVKTTMPAWCISRFLLRRLEHHWDWTMRIRTLTSAKNMSTTDASIINVNPKELNQHDDQKRKRQDGEQECQKQPTVSQEEQKRYYSTSIERRTTNGTWTGEALILKTAIKRLNRSSVSAGEKVDLLHWLPALKQRRHVDAARFISLYRSHSVAVCIRHWWISHDNVIHRDRATKTRTGRERDKERYRNIRRQR